MIRTLIKIAILSFIGFIEIMNFIHPQERVISANESIRKLKTRDFVSNPQINDVHSRHFSINACEIGATLFLFLVGGAPQAIMILCQSIIMACIEMSSSSVNEKLIRLDCLITALVCITGFTI